MQNLILELFKIADEKFKENQLTEKFLQQRDLQ